MLELIKLRKDLNWCIGKIKCLFDRECLCQVESNISSLSEIPVGIWVDGKTIYRKVIIETWDFATTSIATFFPEGPPGSPIRLIPFASNAIEIIDFKTRVVSDYSMTPRNIADRNSPLGVCYSIVNGKTFGTPESPTYIELYRNGFSPLANSKIKFTHIVEYVKL